MRPSLLNAILTPRQASDFSLAVVFILCQGSNIYFLNLTSRMSPDILAFKSLHILTWDCIFRIHSPLYPSTVWVWTDCIFSWLCYFTHTWHAPVFPCSPMMFNRSGLLVHPFVILPTIYIILLLIVPNGSPIKLYTAPGKNLPWLYYKSPFFKKFIQSTQFYWRSFYQVLGQIGVKASIFH